MKHRPRPSEQDDLLRPRLIDLIDLRHELVKLTGLIDWEVFEREWSGFFPSTTGRPATPPRLVAGLLYLQHAYRLSDEAVVAPVDREPILSALHRRSVRRENIPPDCFLFLLTPASRAGRSFVIDALAQTDRRRRCRVALDPDHSGRSQIRGDR